MPDPTKAPRPKPDPERDPGAPDDDARRVLRPILIVSLLLVLGMLLFARMPVGGSTPVSYTRLKSFVAEGVVDEVRFRGPAVEVSLSEERAVERRGETVRSDRFAAHLPPVEDPDLLPALEAAGVEVEAEPEQRSNVGLFLWLLLPWVVLLGLLLWFRSRAPKSGGMMGMDGSFQRYLKANARTYKDGSTPGVTFNDVAGCEQAKTEVREIVDFLKDPARYGRVGAQIPRGVLLDGPPGTGKTLMARAVAGEAGVPFFSISASEFIEMFVGVGAARVRSLFEKAKKAAPSIIFIDEIDSIGRTRGTGLGGGHDEREQTLNQILSELDGFEHTDSLVVLAATNRSDVLDPALLRPGRFDRRVTLDLPDLTARAAILAVHVRKVKMEAAVDLARIARATIGFSGADLSNLVNEAALSALRGGREVIGQRDFEEAHEKITFGPERVLSISVEERHRLAIHEGGHTLVGWYVPGGDPVEKVTIVPRGHALGATLQVPEAERRTLTESYLRGRLAVMLAGRAAEEELTGEVSTGAEDDIMRATELARRMVSTWGMDREIGPIDLRQSESHPFLGKEIAHQRRFSEETAHRIDQAMHRVLGEAETLACDLVRAKRARLDALVARLLAEESLSRVALHEVLGDPAPETAVALAEAGREPEPAGSDEEDGRAGRARSSREAEERRAGDRWPGRRGDASPPVRQRP